MTSSLIKSIFFALFLSATLTVSANWDIFQSYVIIDTGGGNAYYPGLKNTDLAPNPFDGFYYGRFNPGDTFLLNGGELKTYKDNTSGSSNVCGGTLYYRVYNSCDAAPAYSSIALPFDANLGGNDQRWDEIAAAVDLLSGLTGKGTYIFEAYLEAEGNQSDPGGCGEFYYDGTGAFTVVPEPIFASFEYDNTESFSDGDFTASPVWTGDVADWEVVDSDAAAGAAGSNTLHQNVTVGTSPTYLSSDFADWQVGQDWSFFMGRRNMGLTVANQFHFWLYANETDLTSATVDGYRIQVGDNTGGDEIRLQVVTDGVGTNILSTPEIPNGLTDIGVSIHVTRNGVGYWTLYTSPLPALNGEGTIATGCPELDANIDHGSATEATYSPSGTGYYGVVAVHSTGATALAAVELDQICVKGLAAVLGCTDQYATNYNILADTDDGSCTYPDIILTEIHYNSNDAGGFVDADYEFFELYNNEAFAVSLDGWTIIDAVTFTFPAASSIAPGEYIIVAANDLTYLGNGYQVFDYSGGLLNGGEPITLQTPSSVTIETVTYNNNAPWPLAADGTGPSAELSDLALDNTNGANWIAQTINGTPGGPPALISGCTDPSATNYDPAATVEDGSCTYGAASVVINELHYNPCAEQGTDADYEFVELYNASAGTVDLSNWQILGIEFTFPVGAMIAAGEYIIVAHDDSFYLGNGYQVFDYANAAGLNNSGEAVALLDDLSNYIDYVNYGIIAPWPTTPNGECTSLELTSPTNDNNTGSNWQASYVENGTPGAQNSGIFECTDCTQIGAVSISLINDDFESGTLGSWTEGTIGDWAASGTTPINGAFSLQHNVAGPVSSHIYQEIDCFNLQGSCTTWRFQIRTDIDPDAANRFIVYLNANEADLSSATVDGFAVAINYSGATDQIELVRIVDGAVAEQLMIGNYDVNAGDVIGVEVSTDPDWNWMMRYDLDGGFDDLLNTNASAVNNSNFNAGTFVGVEYDCDALGGTQLFVDDISVEQCGLDETYYSTASGVFTDAIWSTDEFAAIGATQSFGRFKRMVVQDGHTVTADRDQVIRDITTEPTGTLDLGALDFTITVHGNWITDGTQIPGSSHVIFKESAAQFILGGQTSFFDDLTLKNANGLTQGGNVEIRGLYTGDTGNWTTGGNDFHFLSDDLGTAYMAPFVGASSIIGDVTITTYMPAGSGNSGWSLMGPSVSGQTVADWDDGATDLTVTGITGSLWENYPFVSVRSYDETIPGNRNAKFVLTDNVTNPLMTTGYFAYDLQSANQVDLTGPAFIGPYTYPLTHTVNTGTADDGWNLFYNVYQAPVDLVALVNNSDPAIGVGAEVPDTYHYYIRSLGNWSTYQVSTGIGDPALQWIPPQQAVFCRAPLGTLNLEFDESVKDVSQSNLNILRDDQIIPVLEFLVDGPYSGDVAYISFREGAENTYESKDGAKFFGSGEQVVSFGFLSEDNEALAIDSRPIGDLENGTLQSIPLHFDVYSPQSVQFKLESMQDFDYDVCMSLENLLTGEITPVHLGEYIDISFDEVEFDENGYYGGNAAILHFNLALTSELEMASCFNAEDANITAIGYGDGAMTYTWHDELGNVYLEETVEGPSTLDGIGYGTYYLTITGDNFACGTLTRDFEIEEPLEEVLSLSAYHATCNEEGSAEIVLNLNNADQYSYEMFDSEGNYVLGQTDINGEWVIVDIDSGVYTLEINSTCSSLTEDLDLRDPNAVYASFNASDLEPELINNMAEVTFTSTSENAEDYIWDFGDGMSDVGFEVVHTFLDLGIFEVKLTASNSSCDDIAIIEVNVQEETVGIFELEELQASLIVSENDVMLTLSPSDLGISQVRILNNLGQIVLDEQINLRGIESQRFGIEQLSQGAYTFQLISNGHQLFSSKFIK